jgi:hypothetical protein
MSEDGMLDLSKKSAWSASKQLVCNNETIELSLQVMFQETGYYTVQFGIVPPQEPSAFVFPYSAEALISWSVEGNTIQRRVSVGNGVSISGGGQAVKVVVMDRTRFLDPNPHTYLASVSITKGTRPSVNQPATLESLPQVTSVLAAGSLVIPVPTNAGAISAQVVSSVLALAGLPVHLIVFQKNAAGQILKAYDPSVDTGFIPLAPNTTQVEITNIGTFTARVKLTWGIDG